MSTRVAAALFVALLGVWLASAVWGVGYFFPSGSYGVGLARGRAAMIPSITSSGIQTASGLVLVGPGFENTGGAYRGMDWWILCQRGRMGWQIYIPLWMPLVVVGAAMGVLIRRDVRARLAAATTACVKCGYSLLGIPVGVACPECGEYAAGS